MPSLTLYVTVVKPLLKAPLATAPVPLKELAPEAVQVITGLPQLSVALRAVKLRVAVHTPASVVVLKLAGQEIAGAVLSKIVIVQVLELVLPLASVILKVYEFVPMFAQVNVVFTGEVIDKVVPTGQLSVEPLLASAAVKV